MTTCKAPDCMREDIYRRGECSLHYRRMQKYGTYDKSALQKPGPKPDPTKPRSKYNPETLGNRPKKDRVKLEITACPQGHEYTKRNTYTDPYGYKQCRTCHRERKREFTRNNPGPGQGAYNKNKTHCPRNHAYTPENTYVNPQGRRACRECQAAKQRRRIIRQYGLTEDAFDKMMEKQDRACAICRTPFGDTLPDIDHYHGCCSGRKACGKCVRGLLCRRCNHALGGFDDSPEMLLTATKYLLDSDQYRLAL